MIGTLECTHIRFNENAKELYRKIVVACCTYQTERTVGEPNWGEVTEENHSDIYQSKL